MGKSRRIVRPEDVVRKTGRSKAWRVGINLLVFVGAVVVYYMVFALLFDTPEEHRLKQSTETLSREYEALTRRLEQVEAALDNVTERDRNIFNLLFEANPYNFTGEAQSRKLERQQALAGMTNKELGKIFEAQLERLEENILLTEGDNTHLFGKMREIGDSLAYVPSIQPIINDELTLLTASFGMRMQPFYKSLSMHTGVDYTVPLNTRVFATADGTVKELPSRSSPSGVSVIISHGNGYETYYSHLSKVNVRRGQKIRRGDIIALTGNTGLSLVPHLHYEVRYEGEKIDPLNYFFMELSPKEYERIKQIAQSGMQSFD